MKIGKALLKVLEKTYEPETMVSRKFERYDISFKTDEAGNPILLFMGKLDGNDRIRGERFVRVLVRDPAGRLIKDHWDAKGKT